MRFITFLSREMLCFLVTGRGRSNNWYRYTQTPREKTLKGMQSGDKTKSKFQCSAAGTVGIRLTLICKVSKKSNTKYQQGSIR